jgi:hypothetical protein
LVGLIFEVVIRVVSVLVVVVLVDDMLSQEVFSLLDVFLLVLNTMVGGVVALRCRGGTVHDLPFMASVLLQRDRGGSFMAVLMVVNVVVALIGEMLWIVLTPLWSKWLSTCFTLLELTPVLSSLFTHMLIF